MKVSSTFMDLLEVPNPRWVLFVINTPLGLQSPFGEQIRLAVGSLSSVHDCGLN